MEEKYRETQETAHRCLTDKDLGDLAALEREYGHPETDMPKEDQKRFRGLREAVDGCRSCKVGYIVILTKAL